VRVHVRDTQASAADATADLAGLGVAILSQSMAERDRDRLTARH
jgi:DNA-binding transcriptional LysR family regulator